MKTLILSFAFLSPLIAYAISLLRLELSDPLGGHHESFRNLALNSGFDTPSKRENDTLLHSRGFQIFIIALLGALLIYEGASLVTLFGFLFAIAMAVRWLNRREKRNLDRSKAAMELEFPSFVELFSILVSAGESPAAALIRISKVTTGYLSLDLNVAILKLMAGKNLTEVLETLSNRTGIPAIRRFSDSLIIALERGSPLTEVLQRQVSDVRKSHQAKLIKEAGKAEIALMIPIVFLILPISVLFALWPSYVALGRNFY